MARQSPHGSLTQPCVIKWGIVCNDHNTNNFVLFLCDVTFMERVKECSGHWRNHASDKWPSCAIINWDKQKQNKKHYKTTKLIPGLHRQNNWGWASRWCKPRNQRSVCRSGHRTGSSGHWSYTNYWWPSGCTTWPYRHWSQGHWRRLRSGSPCQCCRGCRTGERVVLWLVRKGAFVAFYKRSTWYFGTISQPHRCMETLKDSPYIWNNYLTIRIFINNRNVIWISNLNSSHLVNFL